jgi:hypothetical protein
VRLYIQYVPRLKLDHRARVSILTDNENTVHMFDSLSALVDILMLGNIDLRVLHIPGSDNEIADSLSRKDFAKARSLNRNLTIESFQPP